MKKVISTEKNPIKLWLDDLELGALEQAKNLANLPFIHKHIAIMPDAHQGYGMPIGGVMATQGVIIPNAVGVDIGCGMCAVKTSLDRLDQGTIRKFIGGSTEPRGGIRSSVPTGFSHHSKRQDEKWMPPLEGGTPIIESQYEKAMKQVGTLGGGNHFIELQKGDDGKIWLMIHSGSRNIGLQVAKHYNKLAISLNEKWFSSVPLKWELSFLPLDSDEGQLYLAEMKYCVDFALSNRKLMMERVKAAISSVCPCVEYGELINIAHNYAATEHHMGSSVVVHRKGATSAQKGQAGIIPGSQGSVSYIVKGLGNPESFCSCSHGAGRKMGRNQARLNLNLDAEIKHLNDLGVIHELRGEKNLDEAPGAYKDIDKVMSNQRDLVEIMVKLTPLAVIKG